jgi:hypothetical protein
MGKSPQYRSFTIRITTLLRCLIKAETRTGMGTQKGTVFCVSPCESLSLNLYVRTAIVLKGEGSFHNIVPTGPKIFEMCMAILQKRFQGMPLGIAPGAMNRIAAGSVLLEAL